MLVGLAEVSEWVQRYMGCGQCLAYTRRVLYARIIRGVLYAIREGVKRIKNYTRGAPQAIFFSRLSRDLRQNYDQFILSSRGLRS